MTTQAINPATEPKRFYRPELDALRFIAFLMVFIHHVIPRSADLYPAGFNHRWREGLIVFSNCAGFGLSLFFFLSAYLITSILKLEIERTGTIHIPAFYLRRILRIWPLYYFAIALGIILVLYQGLNDQLEMFGYFAVFLGNWYFQLHNWIRNPFTQLWSISVEEQLYLVLPILLILAGSKHFKGAGFVLIAASLFALYEQGRMHIFATVGIWTNTLSAMIFFGSGIVLAEMHSVRRLATPIVVRFFLIAASILLFVTAIKFSGIRTEAHAISGTATVVGYVLVAIGCTGLVQAATDWPLKIPGWLTYLGKISYGLYVFHLLG